MAIGMIADESIYPITSKITTTRSLIAQASETVEAGIAPFGVFVDKNTRFVEQQ